MKRSACKWAGLPVAVLLLAAPAAAQVGAVGAATGAGVAVENAHEGSPILGESGLVLAERGWSASAYGAYTTGGVGEGGQALDFNVTQFLAGAFYAPVENLTVGVLAFPLTRVEVEAGAQSADDSGFGDLALYAKYRVHESPDARTHVAAIGQVGLPTAQEGFGSEGVILAGGLGVSHRLEGGSVHAAGGLVLPTDDADGDAFFDFNAAGVIGVADRVGASLEVLGSIGDESVLNAGPGVRIRAGERTFVDGAVVFNVASSLDESPFDWGLVLGVNIGG